MYRNFLFIAPSELYIRWDQFLFFLSRIHPRRIGCMQYGRNIYHNKVPRHYACRLFEKCNANLPYGIKQFPIIRKHLFIGVHNCQIRPLPGYRDRICVKSNSDCSDRTYSNDAKWSCFSFQIHQYSKSHQRNSKRAKPFKKYLCIL